MTQISDISFLRSTEKLDIRILLYIYLYLYKFLFYTCIASKKLISDI